ncbi:MAG: SRPBCC family protein, partial [Bacteroidota bacterium]
NNEENPNFEFEYEGPDSGSGATQCWRAKKQFGKTKICKGERPEFIDYLFYFGHGHHKMKGRLELKPRGSETEVCWSTAWDAGKNPSKRIMAKMFHAYVHKDFQRGLQRLKKVMEEKND